MTTHFVTVAPEGIVEHQITGACMASIVRRFIERMEEVGVKQIEEYIRLNARNISVIRRRISKEAKGQNETYFKYEVKVGVKRLGWFTPAILLEPLNNGRTADGESIKDPAMRQVVFVGLAKELREATRAGAYRAYLKEGKSAYERRLEPMSDIDPSLLFKSSMGSRGTKASWSSSAAAKDSSRPNLR